MTLTELLGGDTASISTEAAIDALIDMAIDRATNKAMLTRCLAIGDGEATDGSEVPGPANPELARWWHLFEATAEEEEEIDYEDDPEVDVAIQLDEIVHPL